MTKGTFSAGTFCAFENLEKRTLLSDVQFSNADYNDIAYDSQGNLHVAWYDAAQHTLMYAVKPDGGSWSAPVEVEPDNTRTIGTHVAIAVDPSNGVGFVYRDEGDPNVSGQLSYIHKSAGGTWSDVLNVRAGGANFPSLAYTAGGTPVVSYQRGGSFQDLYVARRTGTTTWTTETTDWAGVVGAWSSLVRIPGTDDKFAVAYEDASQSVVKYRWQRSDSTWAAEKWVDVLTGGSGYISLAFNGNTTSPVPSIAYKNGANGALVISDQTGPNASFLPGYEGNRAAAWQDLLFSSHSEDGGTSGTGHFRLVYQDIQTDEVWYLWGGNGTTWYGTAHDAALNREGGYQISAAIHNQQISYTHIPQGGSTLAVDHRIGELRERPTVTLGTQSPTAIQLNWSYTTTAQTGFSIDRSSDDGATWHNVGTTSGTARTFTDSTVTPGATYRYALRAVRDAGYSAYSLPTAPVTAPSLATPVNFAAQPHSHSEIDLSWSDVDGEHGYFVERFDGGTTWTTIATVSAAASGTVTHRVDQLQPDTPYTFRVRAFFGPSTAPAAYSDYTTSAAATTPPAAPGGLTASAVSTTAIDVAWTPPAGATSFALERSTDGGVTWVSVPDVAGTPHQVTGLDPGTEYHFRVRALGAGGWSAWSTTAVATTHPGPPAAPTELLATAVSRTEIILTWTDNATNESGFLIEQSTNGGPFVARSEAVPVDAEQYTVANLEAGASYAFRIYAESNGAGTSAASSVGTDTTIAADGAIRAFGGDRQIMGEWLTIYTSSPFPMNLFGASDHFLISSLGYVARPGENFGDGAIGRTPGELSALTVPVFAAFWAAPAVRDGVAAISNGSGTVDGREAFSVAWFGVGYDGDHFDKTNRFELVLINRSDVNPGDFDVEFNYDRITWETGDISGGSGGLGGNSGRVGWTDGLGTAFELPGSGVHGALLDSNATTGLSRTSTNSAVPGRHVFHVRNSAPLPLMPDLSIDGTTEANEETLGGIVHANRDFDEGQADANGEPLPDNVASPYAVPEDNELLAATLTLPRSTGRWMLTFPEQVRVWRVEQDGSLSVVLSGFEREADNVTVDLKIEGIAASSAVRDVQVLASYRLFTGSPAVEDKAALSVVAADLDADSLNALGTWWPFLSIDYGADEVAEDEVNGLGKIIADRAAGALLRLPGAFDIDDAKITLSYDAAELEITAAHDGATVIPAAQQLTMRQFLDLVWTTPPTQDTYEQMLTFPLYVKSKKASINEGDMNFSMVYDAGLVEGNRDAVTDSVKYTAIRMSIDRAYSNQFEGSEANYLPGHNGNKGTKDYIHMGARNPSLENSAEGRLTGITFASASSGLLAKLRSKIKMALTPFSDDPVWPSVTPRPAAIDELGQAKPGTNFASGVNTAVTLFATIAIDGDGDGRVSKLEVLGDIKTPFVPKYVAVPQGRYTEAQAEIAAAVSLWTDSNLANAANLLDAFRRGVAPSGVTATSDSALKPGPEGSADVQTSYSHFTGANFSNADGTATIKQYEFGPGSGFAQDVAESDLILGLVKDMVTSRLDEIAAGFDFTGVDPNADEREKVFNGWLLNGNGTVPLEFSKLADLDLYVALGGVIATGLTVDFRIKATIAGGSVDYHLEAFGIGGTLPDFYDFDRDDGGWTDPFGWFEDAADLQAGFGTLGTGNEGVVFKNVVKLDKDVNEVPVGHWYIGWRPLPGENP